MKFIQANRIALDGTPRFAASHLGLFVCLCPIKRTPCLCGLRYLTNVNKRPLITLFYFAFVELYKRLLDGEDVA